jgi:hypothetical protein
MKNLFIIVFLIAFGVVSMQAATITSAATGAWSATGTWVGGVVPTASDNVILASGHNVTMSSDFATALTVSNVALTSNVATITTSAVHGLAIGQPVVLTSVSVSGTVFNGSYTVTSVPSTTTFTYAKTNANITSAAATGSVAPNRTMSGTLTFNGGTLTVAAGAAFAMTGATTTAITRTSATTAFSLSGTLFIAPVSTDVVTVNINATCSAGAELQNGTGKNHLNVATSVDYTLANNRQVDNLDLVGNILGTSTFILTVKANITGTGSSVPKLAMKFTSGTPTISGVTMGDFDFVPSGNANLNGNAIIGGKFVMSKSALAVQSNTLTLNGGIGNIVTNVVSNGATATITTSVAHNFANASATLYLEGLTGVGSVLNGGPYTITAVTTASPFTFAFASTQNIASTAITGTARVGSLTTTSTSNLVIGGAITDVQLPASVAALNDLTINNTGGTVLNSNLSIAGVLTLTAGSGALNLNSKTLTMASGSSLKGTGTITGNFTNPSGATIAPGASPGTITITGNLTNVGNVAIELGGATPGTGYDQILVSGTATLTSGTVTVTLISGYDPPAGTSFVILDAASSTGTFTGITLPALTGGKTWATPVYDNAAGTVTIMVNSVLPVELTKFDVKRTQTSSMLTWTTASEKDNAIFNIEQSTNGTEYQTVGQVKGRGTTATATNYNFEHSTPSVGINYYRLKQVDIDGKATFSAVKSLVFGKNGLVVKTTLVKDALVVVVSDEVVTPLSIFNISGQQVLNIKVQGEQRIDVSALPIGLYLIRTATGDVSRFVKQ